MAVYLYVYFIYLNTCRYAHCCCGLFYYRVAGCAIFIPDDAEILSVWHGVGSSH